MTVRYATSAAHLANGLSDRARALLRMKAFLLAEDQQPSRSSWAEAMAFQMTGNLRTVAADLIGRGCE